MGWIHWYWLYFGNSVHNVSFSLHPHDFTNIHCTATLDEETTQIHDDIRRLLTPCAYAAFRVHCFCFFFILLSTQSYFLCSIHASTHPLNLDLIHLIQMVPQIIKLSTYLHTNHIHHLVYNPLKWLTLESWSLLCTQILGYSPFCPILSEQNHLHWVFPLIYHWLRPKQLLKVTKARCKKTSSTSTLNAKPDLPTRLQVKPSLDLRNTTWTGLVLSHFLDVLTVHYLDKFYISWAHSPVKGWALILYVALFPSLSCISDCYSPSFTVPWKDEEAWFKNGFLPPGCHIVDIEVCLMYFTSAHSDQQPIAFIGWSSHNWRQGFLQCLLQDI